MDCLERECSPETRGALDELRCSGWISLGLVGRELGLFCHLVYEGFRGGSVAE